MISLYKQFLLLILIAILAIISLSVADHSIGLSMLVIMLSFAGLVFNIYQLFKLKINNKKSIVVIIAGSFILVFTILYNLFVPFAIIRANTTAMMCQSHIAIIRKALNEYADHNRGFFPNGNGDDGLKQLVANTGLSTGDLECPSHRELWFKLLNIFNGQKTVCYEWYVYRGGFSKYTNPPEFLLFDKETKNHISVCIYLLSNGEICTIYNYYYYQNNLFRLFRSDTSKELKLPIIHNNGQYSWLEWDFNNKTKN